MLLEKYMKPKKRVKKLPELIISKTFEFDSAHFLPNYDGKCKNLHGHRFKLEVSIIGGINNETGMVIDFGDIKAVVEDEIIKIFDHDVINHMLLNPTAENMVIWIWKKLEDKFRLYCIKLYETPNSCCMLTRENVNSMSRWCYED